ncbi:hypothetical protein PR048_015795 [Dryococelus australis]|uniref:PiggyBac transposable element-derived protein domain-containing protein n=1 Tax=Dryococelus australis TaxID=614101 RepID=A0ABQ9HI00_9NEOP|nr:hypothetical protein PR048_015795 [Dryococelus australis]
MQHEHLLCLKWKDTRDVLTLSTLHNATPSKVDMKSKNGNLKKTNPNVILDYNIHKTGVDRSDQMIICYPFNRKPPKWETRDGQERKQYHLFTFLWEISEALVKKKLKLKLVNKLHPTDSLEGISLIKFQ